MTTVSDRVKKLIKLDVTMPTLNINISKKYLQPKNKNKQNFEFNTCCLHVTLGYIGLRG